MNIEIIHGPNLNLLGKREPSIYGNESFESYFEKLQAKFSSLDLSYFQSNHEGAIIDRIHEIGFSLGGIILNAGALTHYSYAISDALAAIRRPVIEVHISDIHAREEFRRHSVTAINCIEMISGKGLAGYDEAIEKMLAHLG